jgi:NADH:ubiquinone oxidoreductase subunit K
MTDLGLLNKLTLLLPLVLFTVGIATIFLRRHSAWSLVGQVTAVKAVAAAAFLLSQYAIKGAGDLVFVSLLAVGFVPVLALVGLVVLHRCGRFGGTLNYEEEDSLRN